MTPALPSVVETPEPRFDVPVPSNGYRWWYVDGLSDDGTHGIVVIAFVGSVFSPYYYSARERGETDPHDHCAMNVGVYRPRGKVWAFTEWDAAALERDASMFCVGPNRLSWRDGALSIEVDERSAPFGRRVAGRVTVRPRFLNDRAFLLDRGRRHRWRPIAPSARIEVELARPSLSWQGNAYLDTNGGERALEDDFDRWNWSRSHARDTTSITYAVTEHDGYEHALALDFRDDGSLTEADVPGHVPLPATGWRVDRATRAHGTPDVIRTFEDMPFYARSLLTEDRDGHATLVMHESLSLGRFKAGWVRRLLPFRMRRMVSG